MISLNIYSKIFIFYLSERVSSNSVTCEKCNIKLDKISYKYHLRTNLHKRNCILKTELENVDIIATAFKNRIITYKVNPFQNRINLTPEEFMCDIEKVVKTLITKSLEKHKSLKINFEMFANFVLPKSDWNQIKSFNSKYEAVFCNTDLNDMYSNISNTLKDKLSEFEHSESGWSFTSVSHLEVNINKYCPLRGGSYLDLPKAIKNTKSCLNIRNNDNFCFAWSIVASLFPCKKSVNRTSSYPYYSSVLNIKGMSFPPTPTDIKLFEKNNPSLSVSVYGIDKENNITGPLYITKQKKINHINLLYIEKNSCGHYCLIKDLKRLVRRQVTRHHGKTYFCESCLQFFTSQAKLDLHNCSNTVTVLPELNSKLYFKNFEKQQKHKFVIYADFESLLSNYSESSTDNTKAYKMHRPSCFAYYVCCAHDPSLNKFVTYRGPDCVKVFIKRLVEDSLFIDEILRSHKVMKPLTKQQENEHRNASHCYICREPFTGADKVHDHDHITSEYRGAAHSKCNILFRTKPFIPVIFHNLTNYDSHLFIKELVKYSGEIKIIPKTKEKYLTITKYFELPNARSLQIKFIDSFQFLSSSLDMLSKSLADEDFCHLLNEFKDKEKFQLIKQKGLYPYDYVDSWSKFSLKQIPSKKHFYNSLTSEHISEEEYSRAKKIWDVFNIRSLGEYTDLYLKSDVLLLCDIFEKFRNSSLHYYKLDPVFYVTSPGLSWDAMLLHTGVKLDLISDIDIYEMLEKGIRGGLAQCSLRHAKANNKYLSDYDSSRSSSFLIYLDCNNLYGHAMMQKMPISDFSFLSIEEVNKFNVLNVTDDSEYGYILEVDLLYPENLHKSHSDLPFAPEKFIPPGGKTKKLIASLYNKFNYVIHYVYLKECLKNGLVLSKIHRILRFRQESYLKNYIELNTRLRQASKSIFEKDFFKLLNNAIFGKTIENRRKQVDVKLITTWRDMNNKTNKKNGAEKLIAKPNLHSISIFSKNFVAVQLKKEKVVLDRPIYIGFSVLEYAKQHLYRFHYDFIKTEYNSKAKLCYTDTDSLLYLIKTKDFYKDMQSHLSQYDTSNFEENNVYNIPRQNAQIPGIFKDEMGGEVIKEFVGLRAKLYCIQSERRQIKKAKGISKCVTKRITPIQYRNTLKNNLNIQFKMNVIRSMKHVIYSQEIKKLVLNRNDDKRQIMANQSNTLPWGHCDTLC